MESKQSTQDDPKRTPSKRLTRKNKTPKKSPPIWEREALWLKNNQAYKEQLRNKYNSKEKKECTFSPRLKGAKKKKKTSPRRTRVKVSNHIFHKSSENESSPSTNRQAKSPSYHSPALTSSPLPKEKNETEDKNDVFTKLYKQQEEMRLRNERLKALYAERRHSFHPQVSGYTKNLSPQYLSPKVEKKTPEKTNDEKSYSFHPKISSKTAAYAERSRSRQKRRLAKLAASQQDTASPRTPSRQQRSKTPTRKPSSTIWEREKERAAKLAAKKNKLEASLSTHRFSPQLCLKSRSMIESKNLKSPRPRSASPHVAFMNRLKNYNAKKESKQAKRDAAEKKRFTFSPKINKVSTSLPSRSFSDMSHDYKKMEAIKEKLAKIVSIQEMSECTFEPELQPENANTVRGVSVVKRLQRSSKDYHNYLQERDRKIELKRRISDLVDLKNDLKTCTFKPQTSETPEYIHELAATYAMTKEIRKHFHLPLHPSVEEAPRSPPQMVFSTTD